MNILVACEFSGRVRDAFIKKGHNAISCDLLPTDNPGPHLQGNVQKVIDFEWDMMIAFPPCTYIAVSGNRWYSNSTKRLDAIRFVEGLWVAAIPKICIENPIGVLSTRSMLGKPTQIIQPWMFGHGETKSTCLWLKGLSKLSPTNVVSKREQRIWKMPPSKDRSKLRSLTYTGVAKAMADQWG
jgi:hypothetical protein